MEKTKTALITGVTGQDGSYLVQLLLEKGYTVHGIKRRSSSFNTQRIDHLYKDPHDPDNHFRLHYGDLTDSTNLIRLVEEIEPDEIYNLAAQSHVKVSFDTPSIRQIPTVLERCGCWRLSGCSVWRKRRGSTRRPHRSSSA